MPVKKKKTGLFFGSFNPIHIGHLIIAEYFTEFTDLDGLWFVLSPHNPLKKKKTLLDDYTRAEMIEMAISGHPDFHLCDAELRLPRPSYTIHTLTYLKELHPGREFILIMGSDNLFSFDKWKNYELILEGHWIYVYPRPGFIEEKAPDAFQHHKNVRFFNAPIIDISSSMIRDAIRKGKSVQYFLPATVYKFIKDKGLYLY